MPLANLAGERASRWLLGEPYTVGAMLADKVVITQKCLFLLVQLKGFFLIWLVCLKGRLFGVFGRPFAPSSPRIQKPESFYIFILTTPSGH